MRMKISGLQIHPFSSNEAGVEADIDLDGSANQFASAIGKVSMRFESLWGYCLLIATFYSNSLLSNSSLEVYTLGQISG